MGHCMSTFVANYTDQHDTGWPYGLLLMATTLGVMG
jgi:hypothetical protein